MKESFLHARQRVWQCATRMWRAGLVVGSAGNISMRIPEEPGLAAVTPTAIEYEFMRAEEVGIVRIEDGAVVDAICGPTSEMPMHLAVLRARADLGAIVHTHSPYVSVLSVLRKPLPPVIDEMVLYFGGTVEVAEYAVAGSEELGENVVRALGESSSVILANHGNVCTGSDLDEALHVAISMESCARVYVEAMRSGEPVVLPEAAIRRLRALHESRRRG
ncbi:MAG: class II aldolase/adducin family protein [Thermoanaerobaculia bacterium]